MKYVDIAIPANNRAKHAIGVLYWLLARMVLQMRGTISPRQPWDVMVGGRVGLCAGRFLGLCSRSAAEYAERAGDFRD